ncbi:alkaline phosphatase family protein [Natrinema salifodinae]|uniref:Sulfatase n=1 Tax=Natrinema salifodinae TaxID=1202768 RepID=A0A1I0M1U9_9EURY|nr:hypothetical protein [Natrinema salifodinae]SEV81724.1 hypothetical protein SAMN05216285_0256 [Natrinema salifodinae]
METSERIKRALKNPKLFARGINRLYHRRGGLRSENTDGVSVFDEDWDTLVVLDACRYDMFKSINNLDGTLMSRVSKASATTEWLQANADDRLLRDTVYVTSNPQLERNRQHWDVNFHKVINVWLDEGWDDEMGTVLADTMTEAGIEAHEQFPQKRIVVHYMQPHYPFVLSDTAFDKKHLASIKSDDDAADGENVWGQKFMGELNISRDELWNVYVENLEYVLEHVENLLDMISGKTVITSDHGNYVGERASPIPIREYGHPRGLYDDPVVHVPWLECERGKRREIRAESSEGHIDDIESEVINKRLQHLGYK